MEEYAEEIKKIEAKENYVRVVVCKKKAIRAMPGAREQASLVEAEDGNIYAFGGLSQDRYNDLRVHSQAEMGKCLSLISSGPGLAGWTWDYLNLSGFIPD